MSINLVDESGNRMSINAWNWGVLHHMVAAAGVFPEETWAPKRHNGGGSLEPAETQMLARFLEETLLPGLSPGERLFFNGERTSEPDDGTFYRSERDMWKNYSLTYDTLIRVIEYLKAARGRVDFL